MSADSKMEMYLALQSDPDSEVPKYWRDSYYSGKSAIQMRDEQEQESAK